MRISIARIIACFGFLTLFPSCGAVMQSLPEDAPGLTYYLPKTLIEVTATPWGKRKTDTTNTDIAVVSDTVDFVTIAVTPHSVADNSSEPYVLSHSANPLALDRLCAGIDKGLLQSVEVAADDKSGDAIVSIAKFAGRIGGPAAFSTPKMVETKYAAPLADRVLKIGPIDPLHAADRRAVEQAIKAAFSVESTFSVEGADKLMGGNRKIHVDCPRDSICYRTSVPTRISLTGKNAAGSQSVVYSDIINRNFTSHVQVTRAFMVEKVTKLGFEDGVLQSVAIQKPSEVLALSKLPLTVYDAIVTSALAAPSDALGNINGLPPDQQLAMIKQLSDNSAHIKALESNLRDIRAGDLDSGPPATVDDNLFKIRCIAAKVASAG